MVQSNPMAGRKSFGRRVDRPPPPRVSREDATSVRRAAVSDPVAPAAPHQVPADPDLVEWNKARRWNFRLPWRQLYFLATLFFGVASLALPDSVNDEVGWVLYALMAASLYAGFTARRRK